ncbi:hypothetical protein [Nitrosospira sp. Nsp13]|uniref:hypothetical protein n=1 Tax=Nitrosospira sp. Nsp13 TaxID=1855332 RepID=UPI00088CA97D|nr:hypothetical protein [Nitrosospira sp. Nsp13]SCX81858.1 hypothetical protein SAMN05216308_101406 [Nitrosospira sp. Nsp13]
MLVLFLDEVLGIGGNSVSYGECAPAHAQRVWIRFYQRPANGESGFRGEDWTEVHTSPGPLDERDPDAATCSWGLRSTYAQYHVQHDTEIRRPYGRPASARQRGYYLEQSKPGDCEQLLRILMAFPPEPL